MSTVCRSAASEQITAAVPPDTYSAVLAESEAELPDIFVLPDMLAASRSAKRFMRSFVQAIMPSIVHIRA